MLVGFTGKAIHLWDPRDNSLMMTIPMPEPTANTLAVSPDSRLLAVGGDPVTPIRLWQTGDGSLARSLLGHTEWVTAMTFSPDGRFLAVGTAAHVVHLWALDDGQLRATFRGRPQPRLRYAWAMRLAFSPDGQTLTAINGDDTVQVWQVADGHVVGAQQGYTHQDGPPHSVLSAALSPSLQIVATSMLGMSRVYVWQRNDGTLLHELRHFTTVWSVAFSPGGEYLATGGGNSAIGSGGPSFRHDDMAIHLWQVQDGRERVTFMGHTDSVRSLAFSPDGRLLASGSDDGTVRLWPVK